MRTASVKPEWQTHTLGVRRSIRTIRYVETIRNMSMSQTNRVPHMPNLWLHWLTPVRVAGRTGRGSIQCKWAVSTVSRVPQMINTEAMEQSVGPR